MNKERFRKQYTEKQWSKIIVDEEFKYAWDLEDNDKCGLIADTIIEGEAKSSKGAKQKKQINDLLGLNE